MNAPTYFGHNLPWMPNLIIPLSSSCWINSRLFSLFSPTWSQQVRFLHFWPYKSSNRAILVNWHIPYLPLGVRVIPMINMLHLVFNAHSSLVNIIFHVGPPEVFSQIPIYFSVLGCIENVSFLLCNSESSEMHSQPRIGPNSGQWNLHVPSVSYTISDFMQWRFLVLFRLDFANQGQLKIS